MVHYFADGRLLVVLVVPQYLTLTLELCFIFASFSSVFDLGMIDAMLVNLEVGSTCCLIALSNGGRVLTTVCLSLYV
jgi:hypothetical protein